ncbi:LamG domain-containing protein [Streptomyces sp. NPDC020898]|uniref:LamG domain-containing protein n=1 Tax=Streptomyces sp. NPDC020898 TaxID=3365101 RepID=UPI0037A8A2F0
MRRRNPADTVHAAGTAAPTPRRRRRAAGLLATGLCLLLGAGTALMTAAPAQADITNGLILRYKLDETSGTVAHDSSGQNHDGTVNGTAVWKGDQGLSFNGSNTYVKMPDSIMAGLNSITVDFETWIDPTMGKPYFLYGMGNTSGSMGNGYLFTTGNNFRTSLSMTDYTAKQDIQPSDTTYQLTRGMWKHITYTQTGTTGILYENGAEKARKTNVTITPGSIGNGTTLANYIGRSLYSNDKYFKGRMRDFRLYNRALSPSEVLTNAGATELEWAQIQAITSYNGALTAFQDNTGYGPVIIFPKDYPGDWNNPEMPPGWTDEYGNTPTSWPDFTRGISQLFTTSDLYALEDAVTAQVQPDGDSTYRLDVSYDGSIDQVVVKTNAPSSVTAPLTTQYPGKLRIESDKAPDGRCAPYETAMANDIADPAAPKSGVSDGRTSLQWQQVQALADYNCALTAFDDPARGPVLIFPSDYTGDINNLAKPPYWTSTDAQIPTDWPTPTTAKSAQFTFAQIKAIQTAAVDRIAGASSDTTNYGVTVRYDGVNDKVVVKTDAPASVTDPLVTAYPGKVVITTVSADTFSDS